MIRRVVSLLLLCAVLPAAAEGPRGGRGGPRRVPVHRRTVPRPDWVLHGTWAVLPEPPLRVIGFRLGEGEMTLLDLDGNGRVLDPWTDGWVLPGSRTVLPTTPLLPFGDATLRLTLTETGSVSVEEEPLPPEALPYLAGLVAVNRWREAAGLPLVAFDTAACAAARAHASYLERHFAGGAMPHDPHVEEEHREGYTEEGYNAALWSCLGFIQDPTEKIRDYVDTLIVNPAAAQLYHRMQVLDPRVETVGIGAESQWGCVHLRRGDSLGDRARGFFPIRFPSPGQEGVPQRFGSPESPNPIPVDLTWDRAGFPVTLTFDGAARFEEVTARLVQVSERGDGPEVPCAVSWPGSPANPGRPDNRCAIALIPRAHLARGTRHRVEIRARVDGTPVEERWEFRTHPDEITLPSITTWRDAPE